MVSGRVWRSERRYLSEGLEILANHQHAVTGASNGFSRLTAEHVPGNGDAAVTTLRKPEAIMYLSSQYGPDCQLTTELDVTDSQEI